MRYPLMLTLWVLSDAAVFVGTYALAYMLRVGWIFSTDVPFDRFLASVLLAAPLLLLSLGTTRAFAVTRNQATLRAAAYIDYAALVGMAAFTLIHYFLFEQFVSRLLLLYCVALSAAALWTWHVFFAHVLRRVLTMDPPVFPTLIVGLTRESRALIATLRDRHNPLKPVAVLDARGVPDADVHGVPVRGKLDKLERVLEADRITHLIQCSDIEQSINLLSACRARGITYAVLPSVFGIVERDERVESLEGFPATVISPQKRWMWFFR